MPDPIRDTRWENVWAELMLIPGYFDETEESAEEEDIPPGYKFVLTLTFDDGRYYVVERLETSYTTASEDIDLFRSVWNELVVVMDDYLIS